MNQMINDLLDRVNGFSTFSSVIQRINGLLMDDSAQVSTIAGEIVKDQSIVVKVLRLANSSYYGLATKVTTIPMAVTILGMNTVRDLVTAVSAFQLFAMQRDCVFDPIGLWWHSIGSAVAARGLIVSGTHAQRDRVFVCGVIHDIGKLAMAQVMPARMSLLGDAAKERPDIPETDLEEDLLGFTHAQVGAELAVRWSFPETYREAILHHHSPGVLLGKAEAAGGQGATGGSGADRMSVSICLGNQLAKMLGLGTGLRMKADPIDERLWGLTGIPLTGIGPLLSGIMDDFREIESSLILE
jgi:HD-like signal output (HDOD) protein